MDETENLYMDKKKSFLRSGLALIVASITSVAVIAFPPAPHHLIKGTVRDSMGYKIEVDGTILLKTVSGVVIEAPLTPSLFLDASYRMEVPMDAGVTPDSYKPSALNPLVPFTMEVKIGSQSYFPFEMSGDLGSLGIAGGTTVIDLTLGVDSDGDGIPDQWEQSLMSKTTRYNSLADINPDDDLDGDGLSNYSEYLANTYAYDVLDGLALTIISVTESEYRIRFLGISDHSYTIFGSSGMQALNWTQRSFRLSTDDVSDSLRESYESGEVEVIEAVIPRVDGEGNAVFFKLFVE
ncbi:MAG: hypothetical protein ACI92G_001751 [Candidatus Pelagisphaera sp.]|jgi:hypothetical protein